jgi:hypothetical protein
VQPPLSDAHPKLVEAFVNPEDSEDLRPTLEAIKSSEEPDLPYHGGQMCISEDRSKIACQGEQCHGLRLWLVHLVKHFLIPQGYTLQMARFHGTRLRTLRPRVHLHQRQCDRNC